MQRNHRCHQLPLFLISAGLLLLLAWGVWPAPTMQQAAGAAQTSGASAGTLSSPATCGLAWRVVPSPNVGTGNNRLTGVAALAANDVWAVGTTGATVNGGLILHWDGNQWNVVPSPDPGTDVQLTGITALTANSIWAVGNYTNNGPRLLILHWNGFSWSQVPSPSPGNNYTNYLFAVAAVAPNDVWTAGFYRQNIPQGLFMHWDGTQWSVVSSPYQPSINWFQDLAAWASNNVWAVGLLTGQTPTNSVIFRCRLEPCCSALLPTRQ